MPGDCGGFLKLNIRTSNIESSKADLMRKDEETNYFLVLFQGHVVQGGSPQEIFAEIEYAANNEYQQYQYHDWPV